MAATGVNGAQASTQMHDGAEGFSNETNGYSPNHSTNPSEKPISESIAIVGIGLRLPGGINDSAALWDFLVNKKDARMPIPANRFNIKGFYSPDAKAGCMAFDQGYFLDTDLEHGDAGFFTATKAEYELLDPQQRLLLEVVYEAFQDAGETNWRGKNIGCYAGVFGEDWHDLHSIDLQESGTYRITGSSDFVLANRVSYEYDLHGPSMTIRVGCSSALVGLHLACEAIQRGDCAAAIVGGTSIIMSPHSTIAMVEHGVLSPEASIKAFDADADGYARAEAINAVYIKKLDDAIRDGNPIRAVIRATSSNADGKTKGLSNPSSDAHEALIRKAYEVAAIEDYSQTAMIECHGTGTPVGDPLEVGAVARIFGEKGILIGSVKPNLGHSEGASGLTSLVKAVLSLEHRMIIPNIKFKKPNPKIPWEQARLTVPTELTSWPENRMERISVNSFGLGGANAHVIVESAASYVRNVSGALPVALRQNPSPVLLVFSAKHAASLQKTIGKYQNYLLNNNSVSLKDVAYTLGAHREHMLYRAFGITTASNDVPLETSPVTKSNSTPALAFVFTGQGAQWPEMGKELMEDYDTFREDIRAMDASIAQLKHAPPWKIEDELLRPEGSSMIGKAEISQPLCTAVQIALVNLLRSWGLSPASVVGHSSGEIAGAYAAGALTRDVAIKLAYLRGFVTKCVKQRGAMAVIGLGRYAAESFLVPGVVIACENSGSSITISGDEDIVQNTMKIINIYNPETLTRKLKLDVAYHSHHMQDVGELYQSLIEGEFQGASTQPLTSAFYSSVTGERFTETYQLGAAYWRRNLESPVLFYNAVKSLLAGPENAKTFLEIGPHAALAGPLRQIFKESGSTAVYASCLQRATNCTISLLKLIGQLHCNGVVVDFKAMNGGGVALADLPTYAWNHDNVYWNESRISKEYRKRTYPHHDLLGSPILENSEMEPAWRCILHVGALPWLQEHALHKDIVFPAAGFVATVGEAIRQISGGVREYMVQKMVVSSALILQPSRGTEVITRLQRHRLTKTLDSAWYDFTIISNNGNGWTKNCFGQVRSGAPLNTTAPELREYTRKVSSTRWYQQMRKIGLQYGPAFRGLTDISASVKEHAASAYIVDQPRQGQSPYVFHPCSLDWVFQCMSVAAHNGIPRRFEKMCLPAYIEELYIADGGEKIHINLQTTLLPGGAFDCSAQGVSAKGKLKFLLKSMKIEPFDDASAQLDDPSHGCVQLQWRPDIDFLEASTLLHPIKDMEEGHCIIEKLSLLCSIESAQTIKEIPTSISHLEAYRQWTDNRIALAKAGQNPLLPNVPELFDLDSSQRHAMIEDIMSRSRGQRIGAPADAIYVVYSSMAGLYTGQIDVLEALLRNNVLTQLYNFLNADCADFISLLGHSQPNLKILEIGAGTGGLTELVLQALETPSPFDERLYSKYTYTDISAGFFVAAQERFASFPGLEYAMLDISQDPIAQGFQPASYDLVIASNVLHATPNLCATLQHCRSLLRPHGRLFLQELCSESKWINYVMGVLPGWWLGAADGRADEPYLIGRERWDRELREAGFAGVETFCPDQRSPYQFNAHIVARPVAVATSASTGSATKRVGLLVCVHNENEDISVSSQIGQIEALFKAQGYQVQLCTLDQDPPSGVDIVSLLDLDQPFLHAVTAQDFKLFVQFVSGLAERSSGLLWVTKASQVACRDPRYALIIGMARTIRTELGASFATLELDDFEHPAAWSSLISVFRKFQCRAELAEGEASLDPDYEYAVADGLVCIPRFHWMDMPRELAVKTDTASKGLWIGKPGLLQSLEWRPHETTTELGPEDVEIDVRAGGLNFKDVLRALGIVSGVEIEQSYVGQDCSGVVRRVGAEVLHVKPGDRVLSWTAYAFSTRFVTKGRLCAKIPDCMSFEEAATMGLVYITSYESLERFGRLEKGQTVLIHSGAGGVGFAAIQIAKQIGAEIYVTVGSEEKVRFIMRTHGIPRERIFNSRDESFKDDILRVTNGRGVDVVLNSLSGELLHASWKCVAEYGMMIEIGKGDLIGHGRLAMELFEQNRGYHGVDVLKLGLEHPAQTTRYLNRIIDCYEKGQIKSITPITIFDASNIHEAFRYMQKGQHIGKIVIKFPESADDLPTATVREKLELRSDVSYFLPGGLGGLGLSIAVWLVERGARHLVFMSRSGGNNVDQSFFDELADMGCSTQVFKGDITSLKDVTHAVKNATKPIAGVMQMSMVLRDRALRQMSFEDWHAVVNPKVLGTWNIHEALKSSNLDFFVLFSSGSGIIGQSGQANYASGNTFNDAFVQYRQSLGLPASVLDIGVVEDTGYVSANPQILESLRTAGFYLLSETALLDALQLMISRSILPTPLQKFTTKPRRVSPFMNPAQVVMGMRSALPLADPHNRCSWKGDPRMAAYRDTGSLLSVSQRSAGTDEVLQRFVSAAAADVSRLSTDDAIAFLTQHIKTRVLSFLMKTEGQLDEKATLNDVGLDSLVAIELRAWWRQNLRVDVSVLELLNASVGQLGRLAAERLREKLEEKVGEEAGGGGGGAEEEEEGKVSGAEYMLMKAL